MKYFSGFWAWRSAFWTLMDLEQSDEIPMSVSESCLPEDHYYVSKKETSQSNDAPRMGVVH